ncbi:phosphatidylethanolamine-binding protein [Mycena maculata]|uniref:Phosphatidylethanolamine-binding protein n=1 Tax=Mycena maculata TaxID=230809 RepID=A0AAD7HSY5_9AGAR|nr:phosphatidylethanolamine-binding protein [Mycena maculata]
MHLAHFVSLLFIAVAAALDIVFKPTALLEVSFPQTCGPPIALHAGIHVEVNDTVRPPSFGVLGDVGPGPFVVAMVDPDAPTSQNPTLSELRHFLGGNFYNHRDHLVNATPAVSEFVQPAPPAGSDAHRYIFLLFKQLSAFAHQQLINASTSVLSFNISQFASAVELGDPLAGTFMYVAPDSV